MDNKKSIRFIQGAKIGAIALAGMLGSQATTAADQSITVYFAGGCPEVPQTVRVAELSKNGSDKIIWTAIDRASGQKVTTGYSIYFDPFKGKSTSDKNKDGVITEGPVNNSTPNNVEFKYTIVGDLPACANKPLDPRIRIK